MAIVWQKANENSLTCTNKAQHIGETGSLCRNDTLHPCRLGVFIDWIRAYIDIYSYTQERGHHSTQRFSYPGPNVTEPSHPLTV